MAEKTYLCRCEDVTLEEVRELIARGITSLDEIKRLTRLSMGPCQGRTCRQLVAQEIVRATGHDIGEVLTTTYRPPTRPVLIGEIVEGVDADEA